MTEKRDCAAEESVIGHSRVLETAEDRDERLRREGREIEVEELLKLNIKLTVTLHDFTLYLGSRFTCQVRLATISMLSIF